MRNAIDSGFTAPRPRKPHLTPELNEVKVQTDRGVEFGGGQRRKPDHGFVHTVEARYGARRPNGYKGPGCTGISRPDCYSGWTNTGKSSSLQSFAYSCSVTRTGPNGPEEDVT